MIRYARKRSPRFAWALLANQERKQVVNDNNFVNAFGTIFSSSCAASSLPPPTLCLAVGLQWAGQDPSWVTFDIVFWSSSVGGIKPHASRFIIGAETVRI